MEWASAVKESITVARSIGGGGKEADARMPNVLPQDGTYYVLSQNFNKAL